ncbi:GNAT family N-acetyltransferase [Streptomyces sp. NPDC101118]|uniref:GNAT family N-acetyltransferase n=1 Tax=Streptomyces sp. NPDC101118 TaxID=3366109 RepID=UPI0037FE8E11
MAIELGTPDVDGLGAALDALREWQDDGAAVQLHPGDVGWFWRFGAGATAAAVRTWSRDGRILAVGLLDGPRLLRLTIAPDARRDEELARRLADDAGRPERGVLPAGSANVEAPADALLQELLHGDGWGVDEPWTQLRCGLAEPVQGPVPVPVPGLEPVQGRVLVPGRVPVRGSARGPSREPGLRVAAAGPDGAAAFTAVLRSAFDGSTFTEERWRAMAAGAPYAAARCLVAYDGQGAAVAAVTVWSAGPGRPGLLEPLGVHRDHRGRGYGTAVARAAAAALRELGASSADVCTPSANTAAVATYRAAGFVPLPEVRDRRRDK